MRIENIAENNFQGKFIIPKKLPKKEQEFAEQFMNYYAKGMTNKEYLGRQNFDVLILNASKKKRIPRKLSFLVRLNYVGTEGNARWADITDVDSIVVRIDEGLSNATYNFRGFVDRKDRYIDNHLPTQYNSKFQKFLVKAAMFLGIV